METLSHWLLPQYFDFPYTEGFEVTIKSHTPPSPFGSRDYDPYPRPDLEEGWINKTLRIEDLFKFFPLESPSETPQSEKAHLTIVKTIATGFWRGAQVVLCDITPHDGRGKFRVIAKIYDALWYDFTNESMHMPYSLESVYRADKEYSWEAAVYEHLRDRGQTGTSVPNYFGSWTFSLSLEWRGKTVERNIRLILMEYLDGVSMKDLISIKDPAAYYNSGYYEKGEYANAFHYQENFRLDVLKELLEQRARLVHAGLQKHWLRPLNVMLVPRHGFNETPVRPPRVVIVGFVSAVVAQKTKHFKDRSYPEKELPTNPMETFWGYGCGQVFIEGWVPPEWDLDIQRAWLTQHFGTEDAKRRYMPMNIKGIESKEEPMNMKGIESTEDTSSDAASWSTGEEECEEVSDVDMDDA